MTANITLLSSTDTIDRLTKDADDTRKQVIKIDRQELVNLLIDYGVMYSALSGSTSFKVTEPERRERPRLSNGGP